MSVTKFNWSNGTLESPVTLSTNQINTLITAGNNSNIDTQVSGVIKTQVGIYKYLKYSLNKLFPNLTVLGDEVEDTFNISTQTNILYEGSSLSLDVSSSTGMTAKDLQYKIIFNSIDTDNVLSEDNIKQRISCTNGILTIQNAQENSTWTAAIVVKACPLYEDIETTESYSITQPILCKAIKMTGFTATAEFEEIPINSHTQINYYATPTNTTKFQTASIKGDITSGEGTYIDGSFFSSEKQGQAIIRITCEIAGGGIFTTTLTINVINSLYSTISIWNGGKDSEISDTKSMVKGDFVADKDTCAIVEMPNNVIYQIRQQSHLYVGKYYGREIGMKIKQLSDTDKTKYTDGSDAVIDGTPDDDGIIGDVYLKLPTFYYKCVTNSENDKYVDIIFSTGNDEENTFTEWNTNTLIGVYKGTILDASNNPVGLLSSTRNFTEGDTLHSISGAIPTVYYSQDSFKKAARARSAAIAGIVPTDGFSIITYEAHVVMAILYYAFYGGYDINCQAVIGAGTSNYPKVTGAVDNFGMTDTYSSALSGTGDSNSINFWGLENWWGDIYEFVDNLITDNNTGLINIKNWQGNIIRQVQSHVELNKSSTISKMVWNTQGGYVDMIPDELSGDSSYTKYYADSGDVTPDAGCVALRSGYASGSYGGVGCLRLGYNASYAIGASGSRLVFTGKVIDITDTEDADNF